MSSSPIQYLFIFSFYLVQTKAQPPPSFNPSANPNIIFSELHLIPTYQKTHGILMALVFTVMFPLGMFGIRLLKSQHQPMWVHAVWQVFSCTMMIAGFAVGVRMARVIDLLHHTTHTIFGIVIVSLMLVQPFIGVIHHLRFKKKREPGLWTVWHIWYGRVLILLGIINGGLGLKLAGNTTGGKIAYGVVGGISGVGILILAVGMKTERKVLKRVLRKGEMTERERERGERGGRDGR